MAEPGTARGPGPADYFNRRHPLHALKAWAATRARRRMFARVIELARPHAQTRILDVGTTPDMVVGYANFFERCYPYPTQLTICSTEDCSNLEREIPGLRFRLITGDRLPFEDREFDLAVSFAVLEHVGSRDRQARFLRELARVADASVAYAPYRYFPVEMHTLIPLTHWLPTHWYRALWRKLGMTFWADERNLNLLSLQQVREMLPRGRGAAARLVWNLGWPSNIEIAWGLGSRTTGPRQ